MARRQVRLGMRAQLTLTLLLGALLSTAATLFIAQNAIHSFALTQAKTQEVESMSFAQQVLSATYGQDVSISSPASGTGRGSLVADSPLVGRDQGTSFNGTTNYGKYVLNGDTDYVNQVKNALQGAATAVLIYQCADSNGDTSGGCTLISSTFPQTGNQGSLGQLGSTMCSSVYAAMGFPQGGSQHPGAEQPFLDESPGPGCISGYFGYYFPRTNPQGQTIAAFYVGEPVDVVNAFETSTVLELLLLGVIVMTAGAVVALLFTSAIVNALQRAARQVSSASERIGGIAAQQSGGAAQQVWAVNAVNKALHNFQGMARDIAQRTDQLALMGNQIVQRRAEISPAQIDSILAYMTRSVRDISVASRQQAAQYERMSGAMQAVIEIAEQVAGNSQQSTESAERLQLVVRQLQLLVGVRYLGRRTNVDFGMGGAGMMGAPAGRRGQRAIGARDRGMRAGMSGGRSGMYGRPDTDFDRQMGGQMGGAMVPYGARMGAGYGDYGGGYGDYGMLPPGQGMGGAGWSTQRGMMGPMGSMAGMAPPAQSRDMGRMPAPDYNGGMRGGYGGEQDWRLPAMPPLPPMPGGGTPGNGMAGGPRSMVQPGSGRGMNPGNPGPNPNPEPWSAQGWAQEQGRDPRRSWTGEI
jgi:hypothetical protein